MHVGNYLSINEAKKIVERGIREITITPTALKQTHKGTISFLESNEVSVKKLERKGRPRKLDDKKIEQILAMRSSSRLSYKGIGDMTGVAKSTVFDYCKENDGKLLEEKTILVLQRKIARTFFNYLSSKDLCDEVNELARKGLVTNDVNEMEYIMQEIKDMIL